MKSIDNLYEHVKNGKRLMHEWAEQAVEKESSTKFQEVEITLTLNQYLELKGGI